MPVVYVDRDDETAVRILIADLALTVKGKVQPERSFSRLRRYAVGAATIHVASMWLDCGSGYQIIPVSKGTCPFSSLT